MTLHLLTRTHQNKGVQLMGTSRKSKTAGELFYTEGCVYVRQFYASTSFYTMQCVDPFIRCSLEAFEALR